MKKLIQILLKISAITQYIAYKLQDIGFKQDYYVYVPTRNKPTFIHNSFVSAEMEARRIAKQCLEYQTIEILRVEKRLFGELPDIPF